MKTEKMEQVLMCAMFVVCAAIVFTMLASMLTMPIEPVAIAHTAVHGVAQAVSAGG